MPDKAMVQQIIFQDAADGDVENELANEVADARHCRRSS
jgi:hypothetical protein